MARIVVKWTSKIQSFLHKGLINQALLYFIRMQRAGIEPTETTFSTTLTACSQSPHKSFGLSMHSLILKKGYSDQLFLSSGLISMYSKFSLVGNARQVFDETPERDGFVWNSMISGYSQNKCSMEACRLFLALFRGCSDRNAFVSDYTVVSVLNACAQLGYYRLGESVHGYAVKAGFGSDVFVGSSLVNMYSKCEELDSARLVFDQLVKWDIVVWNTMITGYAQNGYEDEAVELFLQMEHEGLSPNHTTFLAVIDASSVMRDDTLGKSFHAKALKFGFLSDVYLGTALVDMYSKFLNIADAEKTFSEMFKKNVISYNALITGYGMTGEHEKALGTYMSLRFQGMKPDTCTFVGLFTSCASSCAFFEGVQVHSHAIMLGVDLDVSVSIVNFYSKCGFIDGAMKALETALVNDVVSRTAIISGLVQNNEAQKALEIFCEMHRLSEKADTFSYSSVIKAVASLASVAQGRHLHGLVIKMGLDHNIFVGSALIDMYSKCGVVEDAQTLFSELPEKTVVSWNSMVMGYAQNGFPQEALYLFQEMENNGVLPTPVTFVGILLACCHGGFVKEGKHYYHLMESHYGISPSIEHCTCMVNLLGRSGYVNEAEAFLLSSPFKGEYEIWRSLLTSCQAYKDFDVAARVAEICLHLKPDDPPTYTILSNIYATKQLWSEVGRAREVMKTTGVVKEPGFSWIEAKG